MKQVREGYKMTELGEIPVEWEITSVSNMIDVNPDNLPKNTPLDYIIKYIDIESVNNGKITGCKYFSVEKAPSRAKRKVEKNDVILSTVRPYLKGFAIVKDSDPNLVCSTGFAVLRAKSNIISEYIYHYIFSDQFLNQLLSQMRGSNYPAVNTGDVEAAMIVVPSLQEQKKIAEILSKVDEQIENTEKLIEKTKELKKGLMQLLLTKGIGHTEFKQTELGEIPVEWSVKSVSEIMLEGGSGVKRGPFGGALKKEFFVNDGYAVYEQQHVIYNQFKNIRYYITEGKFGELVGFEILTGDLLISCSGTIGKVSIVPENIKRGVMNQALLRFRPNQQVSNNIFLYYLFASDFMQSKMLDMTHGSTIKNIVAVSEIKNIKLGLPHLQEQQKIATILSSVDEQIESYEQEKEKYLQLKKGLMQQLLTGKMRVTV